MPALKWLRMLMNHIPDKYEHLVRYYGYYSNRSRGTRRLIENGQNTAGSIRIDDRQPNDQAKPPAQPTIHTRPLLVLLLLSSLSAWSMSASRLGSIAVIVAQNTWATANGH